jgi:O-antigen ligase
MVRRARHAVAPLYLFACLILGGSAQGIWANMVLQLLGVGILAWAAMTPAKKPVLPAARQLLILTAIGVAVVALQLVPVPASIWPHLAGRERIADGYRILGTGIPPLPISLTPYKSLDSLLGLIPPLALYCAIVRLKAYRTNWLVGALLAGTVAGILLGALQFASRGEYASSPWYLYEESNFGVAVGFFANANHMADLLVVSLPFVAALVASVRSASKQRKSASLVAGCAVIIVIIVGIAINRSLAAYGLALPVLLLSALLLLPQRSRLRRWVLAGAAVLAIGAIGAIVTTANRTDQLGAETATSVTSRQEMLKTTAHAIRGFMPWGTGLGSFRSVYHLYEDRERITPTYVVHAHDDYVEFALETGAAGVLLMIAFLGWWVRAAWAAWRQLDAGVYARAASIASAVVLIHSIVDFPLRTAAIAAAFAMCLALMVERRAQVARKESDLWPTRHVVLK